MKKSQATQNKNPDLEGFQNSQIQSRKTRFFSLVTYASEKQIQKVLQTHVKSVRAFCYILHDKDESTPHYHIILRTHSTWTSVQLRKWFNGLSDKDKKIINTFCEPANDLYALKEYLTHSDDESKTNGKHEYSQSDIKDFGIWDIIPKKDSYDDAYEIVNEILLGRSYRELVRRYGVKFLYHWEKYADVAGEIRQEEGYKEARMKAYMEVYGDTYMKSIEDMEDLQK